MWREPQEGVREEESVSDRPAHATIPASLAPGETEGGGGQQINCLVEKRAPSPVAQKWKTVRIGRSENREARE